MGRLNTIRTIDRSFDLDERRQRGEPYIVNKSDIVDLNPGEEDVSFLAGGGNCSSNPETCGKLIRGNRRCGNVVGLKFDCPNICNER